MTKRFFYATVVVLVGLSTAWVQAQEVENDQAEPVKLKLTEVTVSTTKTERDPLTTPGEVSVLTQEYFQQRQAQSLDDVLRYEPGVESAGGPRSMAEGPNIRGLSGARVLTVLDGVRLDFQSGHKGRLFIDMDQLKQVEVIRGPGSALYGSQAVGGVVAMETKDPSDYLAPGTSFGLRQKFGYQYQNEELLSTSTLSSRLTRHLAFMTSGTFRAGEDVRLGGGLGRLANSAQDTAANLSKLVWTPTPHDDVEVSIQATRQAAQVPFQANSMTSTQSSIADRVNRQITYRLGYTHDDPLNPWVNLQGFVYLAALDVTESRITDRGQRDDISFDTTGYDLRNSMTFGNSSTVHHVVTFGSEFYRNTQKGRGSRTTTQFVPCTPGPSNPQCSRFFPYALVPRAGGARVFFPSAKADVFALYLQDEMTILDRLTVIPAVRWDHWSNQSSGRPDRSVGTVNPKIGAVIQATDFLFIEANYAHGFRQPTFGELFTSGTHFPGSVFAPNPDLDPERSRNVDAGFRVSLPSVVSDNDPLIFKGAYFRNILKNFIATIPIGQFPTTSYTNMNIQDALIQGWEAELEWGISEHVTLYGNYSQSHGTDETSDQPLANVPPKRGVLGIDYRYRPWGLAFGSRAQMVGDQERVPEGVTPTGGYALFDIWATVTPGQALLPALPQSWVQGFQLNLGIDNLTNRNYRRHLSGLPEAGINPKVSMWYSVNLP